MKRTSASLIADLRETANFVRYCDSSPSGGDDVRARTKLYRDTWLNPLIDEIERRLVKTRKPL